MERGLLVVFSAPSGGGKSTVIREVMKRRAGQYKYSLSATTRPPRKNEINGEHYSFLSDDEFFRKRDNGEFLEWAMVHDNYYATPIAPIEKNIADKEIVLLDIDVQGGLAVKERLKNDAFLIFLAPPSRGLLEKRLRARQTDHESVINRRLEAVTNEMKYAEQYDVTIINDKLDETIEKVLFEIDKKIKQP